MTRLRPTTWFAIVGAAVLVVLLGARGGPLLVEPAAAQIIEEDSPAEAPGLGNIVGSPDAGPDPEDAGDRGGWAQLVLAVVVLGGIVFIASRIVRGVRAQPET